MGWINNERYETIIEQIRLFDGKFICAYMPCYGLVKIDDRISKLPSYEGYLYRYPEKIEIAVVEYVREKFYTEGFEYPNKELTEDEIFKILV